MIVKIHFLIILFFLSLLAGACCSQNLQEQTAVASSDSSAVDTDDGPHVFWQNDSSALVIYFCDDEVINRTFIVTDTLRFFGLCQDTTVEYLITADSPQPGPDRADHVGQILAVSDIHGDYNSFVEILIAGGVVDGGLQWNWGDGHLVILGDVFDRGPAVTECLWLIRRLERESAAAGGAVHYLLGNHELMILQGDLRYVNERYTKGIARSSRFAYDDLFGAETELGRWLRTKHTLVRLNRTLFVHGGIMAEFLQTGGGIGAVNELIRLGLDYSSLRLHFDELIKKLYGKFGPLWYRGCTQGVEERYPPMNTIQIDSVLRLCDVDKIVVGHSEHDTISLFHDNKVIDIDVDVEALAGQQGLLVQDGQYYLITSHGERRAIFGR